MKLTAEQQISRAKVSLMNDPAWRWMAGIMMMGKTTCVGDDHEVKTAATNGVDEMYSRKFLADLKGTDQEINEQVKFVVLHEGLHKLFRHLFIWQGLFKQSAQCANIACDVVINTQMLKDKPGIKFIDGGIDMPKYADAKQWNTKRIFDDLMQSGEGEGEGKSGHDTHQWAEAGEIDAETAKEIEKQIDTILRQAAGAGEGNSGMPRDIMAALVPEVDWRSLMAEFVKSQCVGKDKHTWRKPHRTYLAHDLYMPSEYSENVGRVLLACDTSGSIGGEALNVFLGFMQQLVDEVNPSGVDVAWWGSSVVGVDKFEKGHIQLESAVKPIGGGGTDPACITQWLKKEEPGKYVAAIVLTDGEFYGDNVGDWGDLPVIWLVVSDRDTADIKVGRTVKIKEIK